MPVWHARSADARASGAFALVGLAQEQHPERCALFAQWRGLDWPIAWDPFNLADSAAVPLAIAIDEHGVVRHVGLELEQLDAFLAATFPAPSSPRPSARDLIELVRPPPDAPRELDEAGALARLMRPRHGSSASDYEPLLATLTRAADAPGAPPAARLRLGVARRMRHDSPASRPDDFQASLTLWTRALRERADQYIWRRRIQQWGPRLDKPYPFYDWVDAAQREIAARGETPVALRAALSSSERTGRVEAQDDAPPAEHPDPSGAAPRDRSGWVAVETALAPHTGDRTHPSGSSLQVHVALRPTRNVHWDGDAGPCELWIANPAEFGLARAHVRLAAAELGVEPREPRSNEVRRCDFTVAASTSERVLRATAYYYVCEERHGECRFLARDIALTIPAAK